MAQTVVPAPQRSRARTARTVRAAAPAVLPGLLVLVVLVVLVAALVAGDATPRPSPAGLPDAGAGTGWALPVAQLAFQLTAAGTVGALLAGAVLVPSGVAELSPAAFRCVRAASGWALAWASSAAALLVLSLSDTVGQGVGEALSGGALRVYALSLDQGRALVLAGVAALAVAVASRWTLTTPGAFSLLAVALLGVVPTAFTGHAAGSADHDVATSSLVVHVLAASVWAGGLTALVVHLRGSKAVGAAATRFSILALACFAVVGLSGLLNAWVRLGGLAALWTSGYGTLVVAKVVALAALGWFGHRHRRRALPALVDGVPGAFARLAAVEVVVIASAMALGVALSRTPPPPGATTELTSSAALRLGYELPELTPLRLLTQWRPDAIVLTLVLLALWLYAVGVARLLRRGDRWPVGRSLALVAGLAVVVVVATGGPGAYGSAMFSMHMVQHMTLSMLAPILLTLAAPISLALRALPAAPRGTAAGAREWLLAALHSRVAALLTHPLVALALYVTSLYAFYFSPLFGLALRSHIGHLLMLGHFLGVGMLYLWPVIGIDPAPRRLPHLARMMLLFVSMPFHAFFAISVMSSRDLIAGDWFASLQLPWVDVAADQRLGGGIAWAFAELPALLVLAALFVQWYRADEREASRSDRRAEADGEAELAAYNARLAALAERSGHRR